MTKQDRSFDRDSGDPKEPMSKWHTRPTGSAMTNPNLSAIRWIDLDASLASLCSWCRHSEFIHTESGPCLFSECTCPRFFPVVESAPLGESAGESAT